MVEPPCHGPRRVSLPARTLLWLGLAMPLAAAAFSLGSPVCEVASLPLVPMSPTVVSPPPFGWRLETVRPIYLPGRAVTVRVRHPAPAQRALGVLVWAKRDAANGAGVFLVDGGLYQHVPLPAECGQWAATHTTPVPKTLDDLVFAWLPGDEGEVILRAFLIEDCGIPAGCRAHQALTPVIALRQALFFDSFEDEG